MALRISIFLGFFNCSFVLNVVSVEEEYLFSVLHTVISSTFTQKYDSATINGSSRRPNMPIFGFRP